MPSKTKSKGLFSKKGDNKVAVETIINVEEAVAAHDNSELTGSSGTLKSQVIQIEPETSQLTPLSIHPNDGEPFPVRPKSAGRRSRTDNGHYLTTPEVSERPNSPSNRNAWAEARSVSQQSFLSNSSSSQVSDSTITSRQTIIDVDPPIVPIVVPIDQSKSSKDIQLEKDGYVPYSRAKKQVEACADAMKKMRARHIAIVKDIEINHKHIETNTQVIQVHREELSQKQLYWDNALVNLSRRNKELLNEKRSLMVQNKERVDMFTVEREEVKSQYSELKRQHDTSREDGELNALLAENNSNIAILRRDKELAEQELDKTRLKVDKLQRDISRLRNADRIDGVVIEDEISDQDEVDTLLLAPAIIPVHGGTSDRSERIEAEREKLLKEREKSQTERYVFSEEKRKLNNELLDAIKERDIAFAKYTAIAANSADVQALQFQYDDLLQRYTLLTQVSVVGNTEKIEEGIAEVDRDREIMLESKKDAERDIEQWEKEFKQREGREPTESDKGPTQIEMYTTRSEVDTMISGLDRKTETLEQIRDGDTQALLLAPVPVKSKPIEPTIVEVKVRDKEMEEELLSVNEKCEELKNLLIIVNDKNKDLNADVEDLEEELDEAKEEIDILKSKPAASIADDDDDESDSSVYSDKSDSESETETESDDKVLAATVVPVTSTLAKKQIPGKKAAPISITPTSKQDAKKIKDLKKENGDLKRKLNGLERELNRAQLATNTGTGASVDDKQLVKRHEKVLKELDKQLDNATKKSKKQESNLKIKEENLKSAQKQSADLEREMKQMKAQLSLLEVTAKEGLELASRVKILDQDVKVLRKDNKELTENYNSERILRKKYYNQVEDMKGKIRVYCRARPLSSSERKRGNHSVVTNPDEFTVNVVTVNRGVKEFQFDKVFMPEHTQEDVFEDTNNLVQSAVDGYNVCIFAYGQTGSGKTYTIIGTSDGLLPGIAPKAFDRIFELLDENEQKYSYNVTCYMLELYNDKLIDLFCKPGTSNEDKLDIKKDKKGMVMISGSEIKEAKHAKDLNALFEEGSKSRHVASTNMNDESSRSHLVIGIIIETVNKSTGQIMKGKLSLVDLAGSERVGKTGASAMQLKEAMSINKSLSALGDVISALSSEQEFIPYRNNKLTMLMQDSLGGNAKTLMFVNISPADYNADESVVSLTYAARVKLITNDAQKNSDNKEISRLKNLIAKIKLGDLSAVNEEI